VRPDFARLAAQIEVAHVDASRQAFSIDPHQAAAAVVVDQRLIGLAAFVAAQEQAAVGTVVVLHLHDDFKVAVALVGDDDAAVARLVLAADDGTVLDHPPAATAVAGLAADVPARERLAVKDRDKAVLGFRSHELPARFPSVAHAEGRPRSISSDSKFRSLASSIARFTSPAVPWQRSDARCGDFF